MCWLYQIWEGTFGIRFDDFDKLKGGGVVRLSESSRLKQIDEKDARPGDIAIFLNQEHAAFYIGKNAQGNKMYLSAEGGNAQRTDPFIFLITGSGEVRGAIPTTDLFILSRSRLFSELDEKLIYLSLEPSAK